MSWKNFLSAGLLCVLASPVFAAPTINVTKDTINTSAILTNNYLDASANWVWNVQISNSSPVPTGSSPLAAELGFTATGVPSPETASLKGASNLSTGALDDFDKSNPGTGIFGWENPGTGTNGFPEGLQSNCLVGCSESTPGDDPNTVFAALGSIDYGTVGPHDFIQIKTRGPSAGAGGVLSSTLTVSGAYSGKGRIAEACTTEPGCVNGAINYSTYANVFTRTAVSGDANMNGIADDGDLNILLTNFNGSGKSWFQGNFNNHTDTLVDDGDLNILLSNFNGTGTIGSGAGAGLGSGGAVPEPASIALIGLALLGGLGVVRRKR